MSKKKGGPSPSLKNNAREDPARPEAGLGWPGYRTREGRTGWDPIDADNEAAHMTGTILQRLFYGRVQKPIWLFLLGLLGAVMISPLLLSIFELIRGNTWPLNNWLFALITGIGGLAILVNFFKNLVRIIGHRG